MLFGSLMAEAGTQDKKERCCPNVFLRTACTLSLSLCSPPTSSSSQNALERGEKEVKSLISYVELERTSLKTNF